ncbi:hypothetical protein B5807_01681 [Epicoccum nigrum]|uniref:Uncharacterized protein n=1 Tax=Epicoccum nigrum TaxID=105696 RepID=A0A1Y2MF15_EPING|nr:hypothetical protein B5807_01681 [Epicoccum nigrum]
MSRFFSHGRGLNQTRFPDSMQAKMSRVQCRGSKQAAVRQQGNLHVAVSSVIEDSILRETALTIQNSSVGRYSACCVVVELVAALLASPTLLNPSTSPQAT